MHILGNRLKEYNIRDVQKVLQGTRKPTCLPRFFSFFVDAINFEQVLQY
jgi:hypothetical protein